MDKRYRISEIASMRREEKMEEILKLLQEHAEGLTGVQIAVLTGTGPHRGYLLELKNRGLVKQRRGTGPNGRLTIIYVLNKNLRTRTEP